MHILTHTPHHAKQLVRRVYKIDSAEHAPPPKSTKSRFGGIWGYPNSSVQTQIQLKFQFEFVLRDTEESELLDLLDFGCVAFSVETVIYQNRYSHSHTPSCITGWKRHIGCLIFLGRFPEKSPMISCSFVERDLRLMALYMHLRHPVAFIQSLLKFSCTLFSHSILAYSLTISQTHLNCALAFIKSSYCFFYCLFFSCFSFHFVWW